MVAYSRHGIETMVRLEWSFARLLFLELPFPLFRSLQPQWMGQTLAKTNDSGVAYLHTSITAARHLMFGYPSFLISSLFSSSLISSSGHLY